MIVFSVILVIVLVTLLIIRLPQFGLSPKGERLQRVINSPNYKDGEFKNLNQTPMMTGESDGFLTILKKMFSNSGNTIPPSSIITVKTDLNKLDSSEDVIIWFGHSSYYIQVDGRKILVDPVLSDYASPFSFMIKAFEGTNIYSVSDIPNIDYLFITHDHYDHLDYKTIKALEPKISKVITGLGVGESLSRWGYSDSKIFEGDWGDEIIFDNNFSAMLTTARHFSGRSFKRNQTLWSSFVFQTPSKRIYIGGDSGYGDHFKDIGDKYGPFDLAILEDGQYNKAWANIHMMPEETVQAAIDLKAKVFLPVHWAKFKLAYNEWTDGIERALTKAEKKNVPILTPMIGEKVNLDAPILNKAWWRDIK